MLAELEMMDVLYPDLRPVGLAYMETPDGKASHSARSGSGRKDLTQ
ncbi:hypothetical protein ACQRBK_01400 [Peptoniphilaceae bacterium SGI.137]